MAVDQRPVFSSPDMHNKTHESARPVDLVHLARQTGGDRLLEEEVLRLFLRQANAISRTMRGRIDEDARRSKAHTLKGAARAVGAGAVAKCAGDLEDMPGEQACVRALLHEIDMACDYINSLLR